MNCDNDIGVKCVNNSNGVSMNCGCSGSGRRIGCNIHNNIVIRDRNVALSRPLNRDLTVISTPNTHNKRIIGDDNMRIS